jgi:hypothetical protein
MARRLNRTRDKRIYYVFGFLPDDNEFESREIDSVAVQIFPDARPRLYRIETSDPIAIARACEVGRHGELSYGTSPENLWEELGLIHAQNPIVPFFADEAGFQFEFENPVIDEFAAFLSRTLTDGFEAYAGEDDGDLGDFVRRDGYLRLWWD